MANRRKVVQAIGSTLRAGDLAWCRDPDFWKLISSRRKEKTISRAELETRLKAECTKAREEMRQGKYLTLAEVERKLGIPHQKG